MPFVSNLKKESVTVVVAIPVSSEEVEITSEEEVNNPQESNDKGQFRMVVKRMASEIRVESFSLETEGGQSSQDQWKLNHRGHRKGRFLMLYGIWGSPVKGKRNHVAKRVAEKVGKESKKFSFLLKS